MCCCHEKDFIIKWGTMTMRNFIMAASVIAVCILVPGMLKAAAGLGPEGAWIDQGTAPMPPMPPMPMMPGGPGMPSILGPSATPGLTPEQLMQMMLPAGTTLPPGLPPGMTLPPGVTLPAAQGGQGGRQPAPEPAALSAQEQELQRRGIVRVELRPSRPFVLSLPFPGTLLSVEVRDGELVEEGQVLAVLDKQNVERELADARRNLESALERVQTMQEYAAREQEGARENLARNADRLRDAEERLALTDMRAPFAGRVTEIRASAGQHLRRGDAVMELAEQGDMEIISQVPSGWVSRLQPGNIIWVFVEETGKSYEAEFLRFGGRVNASTRTIRAYSRFLDTPLELLPGMSGRADYFPPVAR